MTNFKVIDGKLFIVEVGEKIIGETSIEELENTLAHHKRLKDQYTTSVKDLEEDIKEAKAVIAKSLK